VSHSARRRSLPPPDHGCGCSGARAHSGRGLNENPPRSPSGRPADDGHLGWLVRCDGSRGGRVSSTGRPGRLLPRGGAALWPPDRRAMAGRPHDAVHALAVIDAARTSAASGRVVEVVTPGPGSLRGCGQRRKRSRRTSATMAGWPSRSVRDFGTRVRLPCRGTPVAGSSGGVYGIVLGGALPRDRGTRLR
jgi:hypothetical protein